MQLQIHIENAIEHGLRNRMASSFVELDITQMQDGIVFSITDDGGGRNKAKKLISKGTESGTKMLSNLHLIFNSNSKNSMPVTTEYEDDIFSDSSGLNYGTRVKIKIPKNYIYGI